MQYMTGIFLLMIVAFLGVLPPRIIGFVVDRISQGTLTPEYLLQWLGILAAAALAMYVLRYVWRRLVFGSSILWARNQREQLFQHFTKMSPAFYQKRRVGDLMAHATNDLQAVQQTACFVIAAMAITIDWKLTLIVLLPMPLMAYMTNYYGKLVHQRLHGAQQAFSGLNDKTQESISGMKVIKTFGQEQQDIEDFTNLSERVVNENIRVARVDSLFDPTIPAIIGICYFLTISFGSYFVVNSDMTIGDLIAFTAYLGLLVWPMLGLRLAFQYRGTRPCFV